MTVDPHGACQAVEYPRQEELYFVRDGSGVLSYGDESHPLAANDFMYVPPTVRHAASNPSGQPFLLVVTTVRIPADTPISQPEKLAVANLGELKEQNSRGPSEVGALQALDRTSYGYTRPHQRDVHRRGLFSDGLHARRYKFSAPSRNGGRNRPRARRRGKDGRRWGMDGVEGLHPAKSGDVYYFRPNCTVDCYNQNKADAKAHILAVRVFVPMPRNPD
jgi:hypothetical protein